MSTDSPQSTVPANEPDFPFPDPAWVARVLAAVPRQTAPPPPRKFPVEQLFGIWRMDNPPDDAECRRIMEEERLRRLQ